MAGLIPDGVIDDINRKLSILDVVGGYVNLSRKGDRWWGLCPFHSEKTPSFSVSPDTNLYYCFGCQKGGGIFQFVMEMEGLSFPEAARRLAEKAGVEIPETGGDERTRDSRKALGELYSRVSVTFRWLLVNHPGAEHAREYLIRRGISEDTAERYRLGWAPAEGEWLYDFLISKKYSPDFLAESGLFSRKSPRWSYFVDRLMFPVMPDDERVVAFSGRALSDRGPKYINSPETALYRKSRELYGYGQARKGIRTEHTAVLCEGNVDVLACMQAGASNVSAPLGTAFTEEQARLLKRQADTIVLIFDGDDAGIKATARAAIVAEQAGMSVKAAPLPRGTDPADILLNEGPEKLKNIINGPITIFRYLLDFLISAKSDSSGEAQEEALVELTPYLEAVGSDVRREAYLRQLADAIHADPLTVIREYRSRGMRTRAKRPRSRQDETEVRKNIGETAGDELYLMTAVAVRTEYFTTLRQMLAPEMLRDRRALSVYRVMDELSVGGRTPRTDAIVELIHDEGLKTFILEKAATEVYDEGAEETIIDIIRRLILRAREEERAELLKSLSRDSENDAGMQEARLKRIREIDLEILNIRQGENGGNQV